MSKHYTPQGTKSRFYIPPTLASDFTEFLDNDVPNAVMDFELLQDWYTQFEDGYEPVVIVANCIQTAQKVDTLIQIITLIFDVTLQVESRKAIMSSRQTTKQFIC